jgi:hypothetical protein
VHGAHVLTRCRRRRDAPTYGAGGDHGIVHDQKWLRFPYLFIVLRSHDLHPHPSLQRLCEGAGPVFSAQLAAALAARIGDGASTATRLKALSLSTQLLGAADTSRSFQVTPQPRSLLIP